MGIVLGVVILSGGGGCKLLLGILFADIFFAFVFSLEYFCWENDRVSLFMVLGQYMALLVGARWDRVRIWWYQLGAAGNGSEYGDVGCYLVEKGP